MDKKSKIAMNTYYSSLLDEYGDTIEALVYKTDRQQYNRFALLTDIGPISREGSVLDVGCGLGHLCDFLRKHGWKGKYTGVDINPDMVRSAKKRLPEDNFICKDILTEDFDKRYDYVFCGATIQHRPKYANPEGYLKQMVKKMFSLTKKALAFDIFSNRVDYTDEDKLYVDPMRLLSFCYTLTNRIVLRNDARPYEIMVYLYKEITTDSLNIYSNWIESPPRIV